MPSMRSHLCLYLLPTRCSSGMAAFTWSIPCRPWGVICVCIFSPPGAPAAWLHVPGAFHAVHEESFVFVSSPHQVLQRHGCMYLEHSMPSMRSHLCLYLLPTRCSSGMAACTWSIPCRPCTGTWLAWPKWRHNSSSSTTSPHHLQYTTSSSTNSRSEKRTLKRTRGWRCAHEGWRSTRRWTRSRASYRAISGLTSPNYDTM